MGSQGHRRPHRPDVTGIADSGGLPSAGIRPVEAGEHVARLLVDVVDRALDRTIPLRTVNGQPGLVVQQAGVTVAVMAVDIAGDRIRHIWAVRTPEELRPRTAG